MSTELAIPNPCNLSIEVLEIDEVGSLYSFRCDLGCRFEFFGCEFIFRSSSLWFEPDVVDKFLSSLRKIHKGQHVVAELHDLSREFVYIVSIGGVHVIAQGRGGGFRGESTVLLEGEYPPDPEFVPQHIWALESFPKWW